MNDALIVKEENPDARIGVASEMLRQYNIHVGRRILSGKVILYREPKTRYKKDGTPMRTIVTPWADMTKEEAKALAFLLLTATGEEL